MEILTNIQSVKSIISIALLAMAVFAFARLFFFKDDEAKKWQKVFGALVILTIALLSENGWAISIAVVIGGLIVASEDFMRFIAAIFKSNPDKIAEIIKAFKATDQEVESKLKEDIRELQITPAPKEQLSQTLSERVRERMANMKKVEDLVHDYLSSHIRGYESHQKITSKMGSIVVDGLIRRGNGKIGAIVEIKYITPKSFPNLKYLIHNFYGKLSRTGANKRAMFVIIAEGMTAEEAWKMREENKTLVSLMFFKITDDQIEIIDP
ncbi:MAG: hypothetical protein M1338_04860, partial [Patescibacteria group bacterium]|nr:hypothetical protein [Patescibacteria group bacterium]